MCEWEVAGRLCVGDGCWDPDNTCPFISILYINNINIIGILDIHYI